MKTPESLRLIDKPTFFGALGLLLAVTVPLFVFPVQGAERVLLARNFITENLGFLYLAMGVGAGAFMLFIAFSDIGDWPRRIGKRPLQKTFAWSNRCSEACAVAATARDLW